MKVTMVGPGGTDSNSATLAMQGRRSLRRIYATIVVFLILLGGSSAYGQFWDKLTNPQITVNLTHPPRLGLNLKKFAFGPTYGSCSDEFVDRLSRMLISNNVEVIDQITLGSQLAQRQMSLNTAMDSQRAAQVGSWLGPAALIFVRVSNCDVEHHMTQTERREEIRDDRNDKDKRDQQNKQQGKQQGGDQKDKPDDKRYRIIHTNFAISTVHLRGTLQTVDVTNGRIFSATPMVQDFTLQNQADERFPEFPPDRAVREPAVERAAEDALTMYVPWNEQKRLYFFDDKTCNLGAAYALLKGGDFEGTLRLSVDNAATCKTMPNVKENTLAHAYYNAGLAYLLLNDHEHALNYLEESAKLKGGDIVQQTITETENSAQLEAEMRQVVERTEEFEQSQVPSIPANTQAAPAPVSQGGQAAPTVEDRLRQLDDLLNKGLISKQEYDEKRREILKEL